MYKICNLLPSDARPDLGENIIYLIYGFYWMAAIAILSFSWLRAGSILHPHFMFSCMIVVHFSDFLIRGYDDRNIQYIDLDDLYIYQLATIVSILVVVGTTALIRQPYEAFVFSSPSSPRPTKRRKRVSGGQGRENWLILGGAFLILGFEILKRLYAVGGDPVEVMSQMLGPRGFRDWDVASEYGKDNAIFQFFRAVIPFSSIALTYVLMVGHRESRIVAALALPITMFILVTDGSRTPVVMALASLAIFALIHLRSSLAKISVIALSVSAAALLTSLMYRFRSAGYSASATVDRTLVYHQDDSIYRAWFAYDFSERSAHYWSFFEHFYLILVMPIPRAIWPDKPVLSAEFYAGYKLDYVTILYIGDSVAMFGMVFGTIFSVIFAIIIYRVFYTSMKLIPKSMGTAAYLILSLYVYMILRSIPNLTAFIYLPAATLFGFWIVNRPSNSRLPVGSHRFS